MPSKSQIQKRLKCDITVGLPDYKSGIFVFKQCFLLLSSSQATAYLQEIFGFEYFPKI